MLANSFLFDPGSDRHATALLDVILGEYKFHEGIRIYHGPDSAGDASLTEVHESVHLHLCTLTSYGVFQRFLSGLTGHPGTPEAYQAAGKNALTLSIPPSWLSHEGAATCIEFIFYLLYMAS